MSDLSIKFLSRIGDYNGCEDTDGLSEGVCTFDEKNASDGKVAGLTTDSLRTVAMLFVNDKNEQVDVAQIAKFFVVSPDLTSERGAEGIPFNRHRQRVGFDNIVALDDSFWTCTDDTVNIFLQTMNGMRTVSVDINDDFDSAEETARTMFYSAIRTLGMDTRWDDRMVFYMGSPFFRLREGFRDKDVQDYMAIVQAQLSAAQLFEKDERKMDGVLAIVYAFAPTMNGEKNIEGEWLNKMLVEKLGPLTDQVAFATVLHAGYSLHRADDILAELKGKNPGDVEKKKADARKYLEALFKVIGHSDNYNVAFNQVNSEESKKLYSQLLIDQREFVRVMRERGEAILAELDMIEGGKCEMTAKDCKSSQSFDADMCACVDKPKPVPVTPKPPRPQPTTPKPPPPVPPTATPPAGTGKTIPNPF